MNGYYGLLGPQQPQYGLLGPQTTYGTPWGLGAAGGYAQQGQPEHPQFGEITGYAVGENHFGEGMPNGQDAMDTIAWFLGAPEGGMIAERYGDIAGARPSERQGMVSDWGGDIEQRRMSWLDGMYGGR